ncbi:tetratricopeptide repeat protein [Aquimarina algiphila]|uniref:Tetratricopeptide repeat protein n=1 Tax=Aquimarina algiphila TaxID=2047982 RepID=A0A554VAX8_9FLAO|nr:tetratricopeptide repeat protein [Aquimarina algiphila]TSE03470.1 tetratricopeptide repeat protein [Aquimarina algiphila]
MRIFYLVFVLCYGVFLSQELSAQNLKIVDSLRFLVNDHDTPDSTLVIGYNDLGIQYATSDSKLAKTYINKALKIAKSSKNQRGIAGAQNCLGIVYYYQKQYDSALVYFNKALAINKREKYYWGQGSALHQIGVIHKYQANYLRAIESFQKSRELFHSINDSISFAKAIENIGSCYYYIGNHHKAMEFHLQAMSIYEKKHDINGISREYNYLSRSLIDQKEYQKALDYLNEALIVIRKSGNNIQVAVALQNIVRCYVGLNNYDKALKYSMEALEYKKLSGNKKNIASTQSSIGEIYYHLKDYNKAIDYLKKSLENHVYNGDYTSKMITCHRLSKTYLAIHKLGQAKFYATKALGISKKIKNLKGEKNTYTILASIVEQEGRGMEASGYYKKALELKDSMLKIENEKQARQLQMMYETEQKELQIDQQENEIQLLKQRVKINKLKYSLLIIVLVLILIILGFGFYETKQKIERSKLLAKHSRLEKEKLDDELSFKKRELITHALHLAKKNTVLEKLKQTIEKFVLAEKENITFDYRQLTAIIQQELRDDESWENFRNYFEHIHQDFYTTVKKKYPKITPGELRLIALLKMNLSYKEIGGILNITQEGVKKARYRLRKKLNIKPEESLQNLVMNL